jgi:Holliday junction resolvase
LNSLTKIAVNNYKQVLPLEQDIQRDILKFLEKNGILAIKHNNIGIYARAGVPDILCCANGGKFIGIEVKRPGQKPKPIQKAFLDTINSLGGIAFSAVSVEEVESNLKKHNVL